MNKNYLILFFIFMLSFSQMSYADAIYSILNAVRHLEQIESGMQAGQLDILKSQLDVENLMKQVNASMIGNSGWGTYQFHDYQSYGAGANDWASVLQMIKAGGSSGAFGQAVNSISNQFPVDYAVFNKGMRDEKMQRYYASQSQTILAARAASQLDYDKIQDQIAYQQMLQQQIEKTTNLKAAVDLNNRIQVESNLINLEILRQTSIGNQQQAMSQQVGLIHALSNAKFLTKQ